MASTRPHLADLLDTLLGRTAGPVGECADAARLLAAGRRALAAKRPGRRAMARAERVFRDAMRPRPPLLRLVLDTLLAPAHALRATATTARFLRFEGAVTVELRVSSGARGIDLQGQLTPADFAGEVVLRGTKRKRVPVDADGTFTVRGLTPGTVDLEVGTSRIKGLVL